MGLCGNYIGNDGAKAIGRALMLNKGLESLNLRVNRITMTDVGLQAILCVGLLRNKTLRVVDLTENMISETEREQTIHMMEQHREAVQQGHHTMALLISDPESLIELFPCDMCIIDDIISLADASLSQCQVKF